MRSRIPAEALVAGATSRHSSNLHRWNCDYLGRGRLEHPEVRLEQIEDEGNGGVDLPP